MKHSRKRIAAGVLAALVAAGSITALATQGSKEDPLVTLSYLNQVVTPQLESKVAQAVEQNAAALQEKLEAAIADYETRVDETLASAGASNRFVSKTLQKDERLTVGAGHEILLLSGSAKALGELVDTTAGKAISAGSGLTAGHLYVTAAADSGMTASGDVSLMWR